MGLAAIGCSHTMNLGRPPYQLTTVSMSERTPLQDQLAQVLREKEYDATEQLDVIEENLFTLLSDIRDLRLQLMRIDGMREKLVLKAE